MGSVSERAEQDDQRRQVEAMDRERRAEMAPAPRLLRTPREEVEAYILSAGECLRGSEVSVAGALRALDRALCVVRDDQVVDGAALFESMLSRALDALREGEDLDAQRAILEAVMLLRRRARYGGAEIEIPRGDSPALATELGRKRDAVRAVLAQHDLQVRSGDASAILTDDAIDEVIAAAETGI